MITGSAFHFFHDGIADVLAAFMILILVLRPEGIMGKPRIQLQPFKGGYFQFVEHHENYLDAARREVIEETGPEIKITSLVNYESKYTIKTDYFWDLMKGRYAHGTLSTIGALAKY